MYSAQYRRLRLTEARDRKTRRDRMRSCRWMLERQSERENAALSHLADKIDSAAMQLHESSGERQAQPGSLLTDCTRRIDLPKRFEQSPAISL